MKQQHTPPPTMTTTPCRLKVGSKAKESPKQGTVNGHVNGVLLSPSVKARPDVKENLKTRKSLVLNKLKSGGQMVGPQKSRVVEQFSMLRRPSARKNEDGVADEEKKELQEKLQFNENLIKDLQSQLLTLKAELDKAQNLNAELESQNRKLTKDIAVSPNEIAALNNRHQRETVGEYQSPKFNDIQKLIANKLEYSKVTKVAINESNCFKPPPPPPPPPPRTPIYPIFIPTDAERKAPGCPSLPPPPPPLPPRPQARVATTPKAPTFVQFYHLLTKKEGKRDPPAQGNHNKLVADGVHNSIVGEIQNRSAHLLAIKADIETKGDFINGLIEEVLAAAYTDVEDVVKFVEWLDFELLSLADERAVLKHFKWPERKADAMREAAVEYRDLKLLENEISSYKDDPSTTCKDALKKMASLLDKSERSIQKLIKLRNSALHSYKEFNIPIDWMLDSGIMSKIKHASMKLAKMYMKRVTWELELACRSDREYAQEALLLQGVHFAYRVHQFAGGLDSETVSSFEEIRKRVSRHVGGSRGELLIGIPLPSS
ncbi:hypothetical protein CFOL_v3_28776 [Cephalotus follicularis]|uniref:Protein CHUP1, chloroplastic n=1 Tax=Cephalotus follicularis TaxID=3775 RepID=A0A1Q3CZ21_CEPFO|nr:hypothetical protein CFOL_v3_28776 [Cephalotus follicularis]